MMQSTTQRAFFQGTLRLFLLFALGVSVLIVFHMAPRWAIPVAASEVGEADKNSDNQVDAKDLILLLEGWTPGEFSVSEMLQMGQSWQSGDPEPATFTATYTATSTDTPCDTFTYTPTSTPEANTATFTPRPTGTPTPTAVDPELFYYLSGKKVFLAPSQTRIIVVFQEGIGVRDREAFLSRYSDLSGFMDVEPLANMYWRVELSRAVEWNELKDLISLLSQDVVVSFVSFAWSTWVATTTGETEMDIFFTGPFSAKFKNNLTQEQIDSFNVSNNVEVLESGALPGHNGRYLLRTIALRNALQTLNSANFYYESGLVEFSSPNKSGGYVLAKSAEVDEPESEYWFYVRKRRVNLFPDVSRIGIVFRNKAQDSALNDFMSDNVDLLTQSPINRFGASSVRIAMFSRIRSVDELGDSISRISRDPRVEFCSPVFTDSKGFEKLLTNSIIVKFHPDMTHSDIVSFLRISGFQILESGDLPAHNGRYLVTLPGVVDAREFLTKANSLVESGKVRFASPNFMRSRVLLSPTPIPTPNDTFFVDQWHLEKISAHYGWALETGDSSIVIAIIDTGIDLDHPDLDSNIWVNSDEIAGNKIDDDSNSYDDDRYGYDFLNEDPDPEDDNFHGTACAGLAAAETNNGQGVAGVAWTCKLMALKVFDSQGYSYDDTDAANAINYAANNGADVLSNSWGWGEETEAITDAIDSVRKNGRNGKGCVLVFASGNGYSGWPAYPGELDQVICVGATDPDDVRWAYSNYGDPLDVMAPSNDPDTQTLVTTDIQGTDGMNNYLDLIRSWNDYESPYQAYTKNMGKTSGACPQVAGLAALLLSQNPNLTAGEVQSIIQASADDIDDPDWDQETGWGRINVYNALATATPGIGRYEIKDEDLGEGVAFDEHGFLYLSGRLKGTQLPEGDNTPIPTPNPNKTEFVILNANQTPVALVDIAEGDLYIKGSVNTRLPVPTPNPNKGEFYIRNPQSTPVALINEDGDLYLTGQYYNESYP